MSDSINRRHFLKKAGAAGIGLGMAGYFGHLQKINAQSAPTADRKVGPGAKTTVAVIGMNGRGLAHIDCLTSLRDVEITHLCDVDSRAITKGAKECAKKQKNVPKGVGDFRKILADESIDAVTIATPDHWHTPMAILALAAGKHVYVEKPCSHNPEEGEWLVAAAAKAKGVCQMGNQRRSFPNLRAAIKAIHDGIIGKAYMGRCWYVNNRVSIGHGKSAPVPEWLDYELWQGPAPRQPYVSNLIHYNWHWFWRYGTGEALNNGTHEVDVARWALGLNFPVRVSSNGGRYAFQDDWQTPDTQVISWDFAEGKSLSWEGNSCNNYPIEGLPRGTMIYGTEGTALLDGNNFKIYDSKQKVVMKHQGGKKANPTNILSGTGADLDVLHFKNFIDAIRLGQPINSPITEGHKSVTLLHLGNIAWRTGRSLDLDTSNGHIKNDDDAMKLWQRDYEPGWKPVV